MKRLPFLLLLFTASIATSAPVDIFLSTDGAFYRRDYVEVDGGSFMFDYNFIDASSTAFHITPVGYFDIGMITKLKETKSICMKYAAEISIFNKVVKKTCKEEFVVLETGDVRYRQK